jgi:hypothetical protein
MTSEASSPFNIGDKVTVHKNLQAAARGLPGDWSVTYKGKVQNAVSVCLSNVTFHADKTKQAFSRINKRSVHLWARGIVCEVPHNLKQTPLHYAPKEGTRGMIRRDNGADVERCEYLEFTPKHGAIARGTVR